jgi:hypothetical protein
MHHGHGSDEDDSRDYLVQVKTGMEKTPLMHTAASVCIISK